jgi:hypothetical protein
MKSALTLLALLFSLPTHAQTTNADRPRSGSASHRSYATHAPAPPATKPPPVFAPPTRRPVETTTSTTPGVFSAPGTFSRPATTFSRPDETFESPSAIPQGGVRTGVPTGIRPGGPVAPPHRWVRHRYNSPSGSTVVLVPELVPVFENPGVPPEGILENPGETTELPPGAILNSGGAPGFITGSAQSPAVMAPTAPAQPPVVIDLPPGARIIRPTPPAPAQ